MATTMQSLLALGGRVAAHAAQRWLDRHAVRETVGEQALAEALESEVKQALRAALAEAGEALDCGMYQTAGHAFLAAMALAGIKAAKKAAGHGDRHDVCLKGVPCRPVRARVTAPP